MDYFVPLRFFGLGFKHLPFLSFLGLLHLTVFLTTFFTTAGGGETRFPGPLKVALEGGP